MKYLKWETFMLIAGFCLFMSFGLFIDGHHKNSDIVLPIIVLLIALCSGLVSYILYVRSK